MLIKQVQQMRVFVRFSLAIRSYQLSIAEVRIVSKSILSFSFTQALPPRHQLFILGSSFLVLLIFGDKIIHVGLGLSELHLVHTFAGVPMEESLSPEHSSELLRDSLEQLLDGCGVTNEGGGHLKASWWNVTDSSLDIIGDPLDEV